MISQRSAQPRLVPAYELAQLSRELCDAHVLPIPGDVVSPLESHHLPHLEVRGPTIGPFDDVELMRRFRESLLQPSGVGEPTVLLLNLEGYSATPSVLLELVVPLAEAARSGRYGPLALVVCSRDDGTRAVLQSIAETQDLPMFLADSVSDLDTAEPAGRLTPTERETLDVVRRLGGRTTVARFANNTGLEANAATNRLVNVFQKGFIQRVDRPRREGHLFLDPRTARPAEDPADPTSGDFAVPEPIRNDVRALAEMQGREPGALLADAWQEFLQKHRDQLASEHEELSELVKRGDTEALGAFSRRYAKKQAQARSCKSS